ncbi:MAG: 16S rRNA (guanine(966)-N(2))-methyltransferase RsmD [Desulfobacterales bacterium]
MGLRIIGGDLKGKKLMAIHGKLIRPTADRIREAIFNILSGWVINALVLDLFAGTGALGIEALSRGAERALFVDNRKESLYVLKQNIELCGLGEKGSIVQWNIRQNLNCIKSIGQKFDLIFLDPPYNKNLVTPSLINLDKSDALKNEACVVVEHSVHESLPMDLHAFHLADQRKYGKTLVTFLNYVI